MVPLTGRYQRPGEEAALMHAFVTSSLPAPERGENVRLFLEPRVDVRRPDAVAVYWRPAKAQGWPRARKLLKEQDLQLLHFLHLLGPQPIVAIERSRKGARASLKRLAAADVVYVKGKKIHARRLDRIFAVTQIISIEAKVASPAKAVEQATLNTLFSSKAYILTAGASVSSRITREAKARGVGVWTASETFDEVVKPRRFRLPQTYASWVFNEWAWRRQRPT